MTIEARYYNHTLGMHADIVKLSCGKFQVTEYDSLFGYNCGTKTFSGVTYWVR